MKRYWLRAETEEEMKAALPAMLDEAGAWIRDGRLDGTPAWNLDPIGAVVDIPAVIDPETGGFTEATFKAGWHMNALAYSAAAEAIFDASGCSIAPPANPARVYAGEEL